MKTSYTPLNSHLYHGDIILNGMYKVRGFKVIVWRKAEGGTVYKGELTPQLVYLVYPTISASFGVKVFL